MKKGISTFALYLILISVVLVIFSGCTDEVSVVKRVFGEDLMMGIEVDTCVENADISRENTVLITDFAMRLFQKSMMEEEGNALVSPLSVINALAMTANGARGETLSQMEEVFGAGVPELNKYLHAYIKGLPAGDKFKLSIANSIWFRDDERFTVEPDFLQANANWYGAGMYKAPFNNLTLKAINKWVEVKTDGMIKNILDEIPQDAVMYLINALAFDAEWDSIYYDHQVRDGEFTKEDGEKQKIELMYSEEGKYLTDDDATGFIKYYNGCEYAFAALLPDEGLGISDYVASLTGQRLSSILANPENTKVNAAIPKFESESSFELSDTLKTMGMTNAFDGYAADFSGIGSSTNGNIFISRVIHKTFIAVDEKGTKAGAATIVEKSQNAALVDPEPVKVVHLDRPFLYMIIDCKTNMPIFIGTAMEI